MNQAGAGRHGTNDARRTGRNLAALWYAAFMVLGMSTVHAQGTSRAASPDAWNKILESAKKEGKIVVYSTANVPVNERIVATFNAANLGITMELVRLIGSAVTAKLDQERQVTGVDGGDVFIAADIRWAIDLQKKGLLNTPVGPSSQAWPDQYMRYGQVVLLGLNPWTITYNTNLVKTPITGYQDLLRPELRGRLGTLDLVAEIVTTWYQWLDQTHPGYLEKLASHSVRLYPGSTAATNANAAGEIWVNALSLPSIDKSLMEKGAPIRSVIPNPALGTGFASGIVKWTKRPNASLIAMDYLLSVRGQSAIVGNQESASPLPNVPGSMDISKLNLQFTDPEKVTPESIKAFEARWSKLFKQR